MNIHGNFVDTPNCFNAIIPPAFTISLDCEGLWGMADQLNVIGSDVINDQSLRQAYLFLAETLDRAGLRATAAFVSVFSSERDIVQQHMQVFALIYHQRLSITSNIDLIFIARVQMRLKVTAAGFQ